MFNLWKFIRIFEAESKIKDFHQNQKVDMILFSAVKYGII